MAANLTQAGQATWDFQMLDGNNHKGLGDFAVQ